MVSLDQSEVGYIYLDVYLIFDTLILNKQHLYWSKI